MKRTANNPAGRAKLMRTAAAGAVAALLLGAGLGLAPAGTTIVVAADGSGDYRTVQEAVAAVPDDSDTRTVIRIKPGRYEGQILIPKPKRNVSFIGEGTDNTILTYELNVYDPAPETVHRLHRGCGVVVLAEGFRAENLTFETLAGDYGQSMALKIDADKAVVKGCRLLGWQDTLLVHRGRQYFVDCYIEGRVDFIYGSGTTVFERCHIHSKNGGYVTAASTPQENEFGFVFLDCKLTGDDVPWVPVAGTWRASTMPTTQPRKPDKRTYLGRPWRPFGAVAFIRCELGDHIRPEGWHNWRKAENEKTARFVEYRNTGPGAEASGRVPWARQLSDEEAARFTVGVVFKGADAWDPTKE